MDSAHETPFQNWELESKDAIVIFHLLYLTDLEIVK
jgi:hypothetical protein